MDRRGRAPQSPEAVRNRRVSLSIDGISDFSALHGGKQKGEVQLCAFDVLAIEGEDVRDLPLLPSVTNLTFFVEGGTPMVALEMAALSDRAATD